MSKPALFGLSVLFALTLSTSPAFAGATNPVPQLGPHITQPQASTVPDPPGLTVNLLAAEPTDPVPALVPHIPQPQGPTGSVPSRAI
jgi:hypothetical protein